MAIKVVQAKEKKYLHRLAHECDLLKTLTHPNIVSYFGCVLDENEKEASIFMELMPHSLVSIRAFGPMNENVLRRHTK
jgi:serine/threonine protein kinase